MFEDRTLKCEDCGHQYIFTAGEQQFYAEKGFTNTPKCPVCAAEKRKRREAGIIEEAKKYDVVCFNCGIEHSIPFKPRPDRAYYCRDCFQR